MTDRNATYAQRYYEAALDLFEHGQYDKALEHIDKAVASQPRNADLLSTRGVFLHKMNDLTGAIEAYRKAVEIQPRHTFSRFNLGLIFMKIGRILEAIQEWEAVIRINPKDVDAIFNIAVALAQIGRRRESIPFYEKVIQLKPSHVQAHQNLGIIFRDEHQFAKAKHYLQELRELDSTYSEVVATEIRRCEEQEFLNSITTMDEPGMTRNLLASEPGKRVSTLEAALAAIIARDFSKALSLAEQILAANPEDLQARIVKGQAMGYLGQTNEAVALFMSITAENPVCAEAFFQLGNLFLCLNQLPEALDAFERVRRIDSAFASIDANVQSLQKRLGIDIPPKKEQP